MIGYNCYKGIARRTVPATPKSWNKDSNLTLFIHLSGRPPTPPSAEDFDGNTVIEYYEQPLSYLSVPF